jgi:GNAT superfamily N-acetyltransferase
MAKKQSVRKRSREEMKAVFAALAKQGKLGKIRATIQKRMTLGDDANALGIGPNPSGQDEWVIKLSQRGARFVKDRYGESRSGIRASNDVIGVLILEEPHPRADLNDFMRTHVALHPAYQNRRLGTALYLHGIRLAKRKGYRGIASIPDDRSKKADNVWNRVKTGRITSRYKYPFGSVDDLFNSTSYGISHVDIATSTKAHRKRRGKSKRRARG